MFFLILIATTLSPVAFAANLTDKRTQCGDHAAPSGIFVDKHGIPELFCETPICFMAPSEESRFGSVKCSNEFVPTVCKGKNEWTGGLIDSNNGTHRVLKTECCEYDGLSRTARSRTLTLKAGESFRGGAVKSAGHITHFDVVKEVRKLVSAHNKVKYEISVQRMWCPNAETDEKLSDSVVVRDGEDYEYGDDGKSVEYAPYNRLYRGNSRRRYPMRDRLRVSSGHQSRELMRFPRRRMFAARNEQLFPLQSDDYDFYEGDFMPVFSRRSRYGKPAYLIHSRPRTYSDTTYDGIVENVDYTKEVVRSNRLPASYNAAAQEYAPTTLTVAPTVAPSAAGQGYPVAAQQAQYAQPPSNTAVAYSNPGCGGCSSANTAQQSGNYPVVQQSAPSSYRAYGYDPQAYSNYAGYGGAGAADLNSAFGALQCFSGNMTVQTPSGRKRMSELEVGDMVLSIQESLVSYSPVVMHLHKTQNEDATFNQIETEDGHELELTDYHLIYYSKCEGDQSKNIQLLHAHKVREGDCVYVIPEGDSRLKPTRVTRISRVERRGIYSPLTASGDILVNNVLASCHSNMAAQTLQQTFFSWWRALNRMVTKMTKTEIQEEHDVPFGVGYLSSVIDILLPSSIYI